MRFDPELALRLRLVGAPPKRSAIGAAHPKVGRPETFGRALATVAAPSLGGMRKGPRLLGLLLFMMGVSGTIDHLATQPIMGILFNAPNRWIFERMDLFEGREVFANLSLAFVGVVLVAFSLRR